VKNRSFKPGLYKAAHMWLEVKPSAFGKEGISKYLPGGQISEHAFFNCITPLYCRKTSFLKTRIFGSSRQKLVTPNSAIGTISRSLLALCASKCSVTNLSIIMF